MKKIEKLTPDQEEAMIAFREEWREIGLRSGKADVEAIRPTINDFYKRIGKSSPYIWRCESPLTAHLVIAFLRKNGFDKANLGDNLRVNLWDNLRVNLWDNLRVNLWDNLGDNLRVNLWDNLRVNLWDNLRVNLRVNLWDNLWDNLRVNLWDNLGDNLGKLKVEYIGNDFGGSIDSYWIAWASFPHSYLRPMHTDEQMLILNGWAALAKSAFWWYPFDGICFVCDRPVTRWDANWQLHNETGPAVEFPDGWKLYYWHGVSIPERAATDISSYSAKEILAEENAEVRRALMSLYGWSRILPEVDAKIIDSHPHPTIGRLYEFFIGGQKYHVVECHDPGHVFNPKEGMPYNLMIGTRTSINKVIPSLKDTYPQARKYSDEQFAEVQMSRT